MGGRAGSAHVALDARARATRAASAFHEWFASVEMGFAHYFDGALGRPHELRQRPCRTTAAVEIGNTWLVPDAWGTGANTEAKYLLLKHAFEDEGIPPRRVQDGRRRTSAHVRRSPRCRREFEGVLRKHMLVRGGERRDSAWYAVIDDDWPDGEGEARATPGLAGARAGPRASRVAQVANHATQDHAMPVPEEHAVPAKTTLSPTSMPELWFRPARRGTA